MIWRLPNRIGAQIALLLVVAILVFHLTALIVIWTTAPRLKYRVPPELTGLATAIRTVDAAAPEVRPAVITALNASTTLFVIRPGPAHEPPLVASHERRVPNQTVLRKLLGDGFAVVPLEFPHAEGQSAQPQFLVTLRDGSPLIVDVGGGIRIPAAVRTLSTAIAATSLVLIINLVFLSVWASRLLIAPLRNFVRAAESFSLDGNPAPLPETGPDEIRTAARAFNNLQSRIHRMHVDRTRMLAAVSHDLRTPITRLRLRLEFIADQGVRAAMERDLAQMEAMVHAALGFLRDGRMPERTPVDVPSVLHTVADQFADLGFSVSCDASGHATALLNPDALHRAVTNLVENAVKYAPQTVLGLVVGDDELTISVTDDGPGIAPHDRERLLQPFARGSQSAEGATAAGFGLGLPIARAIAEGHGGTLSLHSVEPHGLEVRLVLPRLQEGGEGTSARLRVAEAISA